MMGNIKYKVGSTTYDIPDNEIQNFLKDNPNAIELETFTVDKDVFDIPINERESFLKDFPTAQSQKKKDFVVGEIGTTASQGSSTPQQPLESVQTPEQKDDELATFYKDKYKKEADKLLLFYQNKLEQNPLAGDTIDDEYKKELEQLGRNIDVEYNKAYGDQPYVPEPINLSTPDLTIHTPISEFKPTTLSDAIINSLSAPEKNLITKREIENRLSEIDKRLSELSPAKMQTGDVAFGADVNINPTDEEKEKVALQDERTALQQRITTPTKGQYLYGKAWSQSILGMAEKIITGYDVAPQEWLGKYDASTLTNATATALGFLLDSPVFGVGGKIGGVLGKKMAQPIVNNALNTGVKKLTKIGFSEEVAKNLVLKGTRAITQGITRGMSSGTALGTYGVLTDALNQWTQPGAVFDDIKWSQSLGRGGKDFLLGAGVGGMGLGVSYVASKARAISSGALRAGTQFGVFAGGLTAESALFTYGGALLEGKEMRCVTKDDFINTLALLGVLKLQGAVQNPKEAIGGIYRSLKYDSGKAGEGDYKVDVQPWEINAVGGKDYKSLLQELSTNDVKLADILKDNNVPALLKQKLLWGARGVALDKTSFYINSVIPNKNRVDFFNENGVLIDRQQFRSNAEANTEAFDIGAQLFDNRTQMKLAQSPNKVQILTEFKNKGGDVVQLMLALDKPAISRTPDEAKIVGNYYNLVDKIESNIKKEKIDKIETQRKDELRVIEDKLKEDITAIEDKSTEKTAEKDKEKLQKIKDDSQQEKDNINKKFDGKLIGDDIATQTGTTFRDVQDFGEDGILYGYAVELPNGKMADFSVKEQTKDAVETARDKILTKFKEESKDAISRGKSIEESSQQPRELVKGEEERLHLRNNEEARVEAVTGEEITAQSKENLPIESIEKPLVGTEEVPQENLPIGESKVSTTEPLSTEKGITVPKTNVPGVEAMVEEGGGKYRKTQINSLIQDQTLQQQEVAKIVDANKERYAVLHQAEAVAQAKKMIDELGVQGASLNLSEPTKKMADFPIRQVARQVLLDFYSRAIVDPNASEADKKTAFEHIDKLQQITAREATKAGQGNSLLQIWKSMQPAGVLEYTIRKINEANQRVLDKKIGDTTVGQQLDELYKTLNEESKKIIDDILAGKQITLAKEGIKEGRVKPLKKTVPKELIKKEQDYRKSLIEQYKKSQGGVMSASVTGLTSAQIELGGNLVGSYVREGYYRVQDIIDRLTKDFKGLGIDLNKEQTDEILGGRKDDKRTYREHLEQEEARIGVSKEIGKTIDDVIRMHWSEKDELRRTLAQKLVDEAGLSEADAKRFESLILEQLDKLIVERSQKQLTKLLGVSKLPVEKTKKGLVQRMTELINMGTLDEKLYRDLFAEKFKLVELTDKHKEEILKLANNIQTASGKGWLERDATMRMTKYIFELYPESVSSEMFDTWLSMAYANMLSGPSTSILNLWSAGWNMTTKPIRDISNLSKWVKLIRSGVKGEGDIYNPFGEMFYAPMLRGSKAGIDLAHEVYRNGDLNNKYVEDVAKKNQFKVTPLERNKYGQAKRFKPVNVKIGNTTIDLNIFNLYKYAARNLSAQDKFMLSTSYEVELAHILRDKLKNKDLRGRALTREVMSLLRGEKVDMTVIDATLKSDIELYKKMTGEDMTPLQQRIRKRELILEQLPVSKEEREEAEKLARSNIFTDERGGAIATGAYAIGRWASKGHAPAFIIKAFVPFTHVVGNVAEYMIDHTPFYGFLRANGMSISRMKKIGDSEALTAQMGEKGSRAYYEQMGRAWMGTLSFITLAMMGLGNDDEDFVEISGGYNQEGFKKRGRENVLPPYTIRIGKLKIPYKNIPGLAIPLALIGNINDGLKMSMDEGDIMERLTLAMLLNAAFNTLLMFKDMSFLDGVQRGTQLISDVASTDEKKWGAVSEGFIKSYLGFATRPLPQNNNAIQQIWKIFDPVSFPQNDVKSMLLYAGGLQHFQKYPTIDQLGDVVKSYPGETLLPYTHWLNIKGTDERWKFLAKYNAIPNKIYNRTMQIETGDGIEPRKLEENELYDYSARAGYLFSESVKNYMKDTKNIDKRSEEIIERDKPNGDIEKINGVREDMEKAWSDAKDEAEIELFRWGSVKEEMPKTWELIKKHKAYQLYQTSKKTGDHVWTKSELYELNNFATLRYAEKIEKYLTSSRLEGDKGRPDKDTGLSMFQTYINEAWADAKDYESRKIEKRIKKENPR